MSEPRSFKQELVGVFGQPVAENPTQAMVEAALQALGLAWRYLTIEVAPNDLQAAITGMRAMNFAGINCTIPHKVAVVPLLDELSPSARVIGAVNCVVRRGDKLIGENTDGKGFLQSVLELGPVAGKTAVLLGAGGAARAIGVELLQAGAAGIAVVNRGHERGVELTALLNRAAAGKANFTPWKGDYIIPSGTDLLINATSIGLFPDVRARVPVDVNSLKPPLVVCDVIPNPPRTRLVREAEERGCKVLDGLGMLVNQGLIGIRLWTGKDADPKIMRKALEDVFAGS